MTATGRSSSGSRSTDRCSDNPGMPVHYDLHVWVAEQNPSGVYAQWSPALRCS
jgi:hypothetical protein